MDMMYSFLCYLDSASASCLIFCLDYLFKYCVLSLFVNYLEMYLISGVAMSSFKHCFLWKSSIQINWWLLWTLHFRGTVICSVAAYTICSKSSDCDTSLLDVSSPLPTVFADMWWCQPLPLLYHCDQSWICILRAQLNKAKGLWV